MEDKLVKPIHEPFFHVSKRDDIGLAESCLIRAIAIALALIVSGILILIIVNENPLKVYASMLNGAFGTGKRFWVTIRDIMTLLCISVGLAPAFAMRFWNIGAEGQVLIGGISTIACMKYLGGLPAVVLFPVMIITSLVCGALWGFLPGFFKAHWNTNETLFTL